MTPIAISIFGYNIHWYGVMAGIGFLLAIWICQRRRGVAGFTDEQVVNIGVWTMVMAVIGARIYYAIAYPESFNSFWEIFNIRTGGLVFYGGFILASLFVTFYCWKHKLSILRVTDLFAVGLPIGHMFGRIGCFLQGCCYGHPTESILGFRYPDTVSPEGRLWYEPILAKYPVSAIHPSQLYEAFGIFIVFLILYRLYGKLKTGHTFALYLLIYGVVRFFAESFRGEYDASHLTEVFGYQLMPGQIDSLTIIIPAGIVVWFLSSWLTKHDKDPFAVKGAVTQ